MKNMINVVICIRVVCLKTEWTIYQPEMTDTILKVMFSQEAKIYFDSYPFFFVLYSKISQIVSFERDRSYLKKRSFLL